MIILIDGDACPVKDEAYVVATRYGLGVVVVANARMSVPSELGVELVVVDDGPDAADDWIAAHAEPGDIVVTADIPLAARCLDAGALVVGSDGRPFTEHSIGAALATRDLKAHLRESGAFSGGPRPLSERDRSRFLSALDQAVQQSRRRPR
ncbi:MAG: YaiI/YqxD family protein [Proteobacteria bacterium]|nr:YaiI/YqxD family protein [Pseudomonadota bacterium]